MATPISSLSESERSLSAATRTKSLHSAIKMTLAPPEIKRAVIEHNHRRMHLHPPFHHHNACPTMVEPTERASRSSPGKPVSNHRRLSDSPENQSSELICDTYADENCVAFRPSRYNHMSSWSMVVEPVFVMFAYTTLPRTAVNVADAVGVPPPFTTKGWKR